MIRSKLIVLFLCPVLSSARVKNAEKIIGGVIDNPELKYIGAVSSIDKTRTFFECMSFGISYQYFVTTCHCAVGKDSTDEELVGLNPEKHVDDHRVIVIKPDGALFDPGEGFWWFKQEKLTALYYKQIDLLAVTQGILKKDCRRTRWIWENDVGLLYIGGTHFSQRFVSGVTSNYRHYFSSDLKYTRQKYSEFENDNTTCEAFGWGTIRMYVKDERLNFTTSLMKVEQVIVNWKTCMNFCRGMWNRSVCSQGIAPSSSGHLCAYRAEFQLGGPCYGDSGTPLICTDSDENNPGKRYPIAMLIGSLHCGQFNGGPFFYYKLVDFWDFLSIFVESYRQPYYIKYLQSYTTRGVTRFTTCGYVNPHGGISTWQCTGVEKKEGGSASILSAVRGLILISMIPVLINV